MPDIDRPAEPTAAERVRSVLAAAESLSLTTGTRRVELIGGHAVDATGRFLLTVPADSRLAEDAAHGELTATVELTDVVPIAVRERVRSRILLGGRLDFPDHHPTAVLRFAPAHVVLDEAGRSVTVAPAELALAEPDPLAEIEAEMLIHLAAAHQDEVALLAQFVEPRLLYGVTQVDPVRLDRYGIVLRLQHVRGHRDTRVAFPVPLRNPAHAIVQIQTLLAQARSCPRPHLRHRYRQA
jgi:hypothetical protein